MVALKKGGPQEAMQVLAFNKNWFSVGCSRKATLVGQDVAGAKNEDSVLT